MATSLAYITKANPSRSGAVYTANSVSIGTADTNRRVIVAYAGGGIRNLSSATIGGVSATVHGTDTSGNGVAAFFSAIVPTGTTANIIATASSSDFFDNYFIVWTIDDTEIDISSIVFTANDISSVTSTALSYTATTGGVSLAAIGFQNGNSAKCPITINNSFVRDYEDDFDGSLMGASLDGETSGARTTTISWSGSYSGEAALIMIPLAAASGSTGTSATTNAADTSAVSGTTTVRGTSATTNAADTSAVSATTTILGTSATTNAVDTSAATGTTTILGTSETTNSADTSNASGSIGEPVSGLSETTNVADVSSASGTTTVLGASTTTNAADTSAVSGTTSVLGTSATTNSVDTASASGVVGGGSVGESATTNAPDVSAATGNVSILGTADITENGDVSSATGETPILDRAFSGGFFEYPERRKPDRKYDDGYVKPDIPEKVKEVVAKVVQEVPDNRQERALRAFLRDEKIRFRQSYLDELKKELIRDYLVQVQQRKQEEETIVFMMMSLMN